ncbi:porin family protein [Spongiibacter taiwanensis]|uniref:porin family protein n=1 Tax=Spongiibacter taiwanensis TaxID=1748242 RepID=UPI0020358BCA|nr:porin family protein [Spongiibacter taiwanensis]USA44345.1 porin family protein [Spongiibacter taiwanensis]
MTRITKIPLLGAALSAIALGAHANSLDVPQHYNYLEAAYAYQSTDWGPFEEEHNVTLLASASIHEYIHVHARYNNGDTRLPKGKRQDGWLTYGIGFHYYLSGATSVFFGFDKHELDGYGGRPSETDEDGGEYKVGIRHDLNDQWRLTLEAGEHDLIVEDDTTFIVEALYQPFDSVGFTFRVRDYDELDLSSYELGVRWSF